MEPEPEVRSHLGFGCPSTKRAQGSARSVPLVTCVSNTDRVGLLLTTRKSRGSPSGLSIVKASPGLGTTASARLNVHSSSPVVSCSSMLIYGSFRPLADKAEDARLRGLGGRPPCSKTLFLPSPYSRKTKSPHAPVTCQPVKLSTKRSKASTIACAMRHPWVLPRCIADPDCKGPGWVVSLCISRSAKR